MTALPTTMQSPVAAPSMHDTTYESWQHATQEIRSILERRMPIVDERRRSQLAYEIIDSSVKSGFDPLFVMSVIHVESRFDHEAVSGAGARGLMQVMPATWDFVLKEAGWGKLEKFDPVNNVRVGIRYMSKLSLKFKRMESLMVAYNAGPYAAVEIFAGRREPTDEAREYPKLISATYQSLLKERGLDPREAGKKYRDPSGSIFRPAE